jgi:L-lactate dehydrogenase complex protein LldE
MRALMDALLEDDCEYVVAPSGSCVLQVKKYPGIFQNEDSWKSKARLLAGRTYKITDFIVNVLDVTDVGAALNGRAAYHPSCHMSRILGVREPPLKLLHNVRGLELVPFEGRGKC